MDTALVEKLRKAMAGRTDVRLALLFGSAARGELSESSDVDVAVLAPGVDLLGLGAALAPVAERDVDVVSLVDPGIPLLEQILRDAIVLHESPAGQAAAFRSRALAELETDRPWYGRMRDSWLRRVAERGFSDG